jgi:hypothetical protein
MAAAIEKRKYERTEALAADEIVMAAALAAFA